MTPHHPSIAIRTAQSTDEEAILDICLRTADRGQDASAIYGDPRLPGFIWALPYLRFCADHAIVLTRNDTVMGYCVAAPDTVSYEDRLASEWWPQVRAELENFSPGSVQDENLLSYIADPPRTPASTTDLYPAHLHINLLPDMQKGGHGSALLRHQLAALESSGARGVHLGIDPRNADVTSFYGKFGLVEIDRTPSIVMARPFV